MTLTETFSYDDLSYSILCVPVVEIGTISFKKINPPKKKLAPKRGNKLKESEERTVGAGDNDRFSTVALSSSTLALIGAPPLLSGFISTRIFRSLSSSESVSELE